MRGAAIIAALPAALYELAAQAAFRHYIADTLYYNGENKRLKTRLADWLNPQRTAPPSPEKIDAMLKRLGIRQSGGNDQEESKTYCIQCNKDVDYSAESKRIKALVQGEVNNP